MKKPLFAVWQITAGGLNLSGLGQRALLEGPSIGFFASRKCPGVAIRAAMDWAVAQAKTKQAVVSGFHSPLEHSVLEVLLAARASAIVVLARDAVGARLPPAWVKALQHGTLAVVSTQVGAPRLTAELAARRNEVVVRLADRCVVAHATPGGGLAAQVAHWQSVGNLVDFNL